MKKSLGSNQATAGETDMTRDISKMDTVSIPPNYKENQPGRSNPIFHIGKNNACLNKTLKPGYSDSALARFPTYQTTLKETIKHILNGEAVAPGLYENAHRTNQSWRGAESIILEYDHNGVGDVMQTAFARRYAALVHSSASSSPECLKCHVLIRLSAIERDFDHYRALAAYAIEQIGLPADPVSERPAQFFYGSTNRTEQPYINVEAMPFDVGTIVPKPARREAVRPHLPPPTLDNNQRYGRAALSYILADLRSLPTGRNQGVNEQARKAYSLKLDGLLNISDTELEGLLLDCEYANGYVAEHGVPAALASIRSGFKSAASGRNGRKPRQNEPTRPIAPVALETPPEAESSTIVETSQGLQNSVNPDWQTFPDAIHSSLLRNVPTIAPLFYIIVKSRLRVFSREQAWDAAKARGMSKSRFDHVWPLLFSPELSLLECIYGSIDSNSDNYRMIAVHRVIEQLRPMDAKWAYRVCHPTGTPPEPGYEDRRVLALPTAEMMRDSGIEENFESIAAEMRQELQPAFEAQNHSERRALYRAKRVLAQLEASYFNPHETNIPDSSEMHTVTALRTSFLNQYVAEHPGETLSRFDMRLLTGAADSSVKALTARAGVVGETPAELPALDIRTPADIERIIPHQGVVKGYPVQVVYERAGEIVTRGIDFRRDARGARRVCEMALKDGTAVKVLYQTAKEYHVESAPLPTKERVVREAGEGEIPVLPTLAKADPVDQPESEPTDPRKYPRRWLVGQYQLALERMGWKRDGGGLFNPETWEYAPDNPRELIELILGRSLSPVGDIDPDFYDRPLTEYEHNARQDFRVELIEQGYRMVYP